MKINAELAKGLGISGIGSRSINELNLKYKERVRIARDIGVVDISDWGQLKIDFLRDRAVTVRSTFAESLGKSGNEEAVSLLGHLAADPSWQVRESVAVSAKNLGLKSLLPIILKLLKDDDPRVRAAAHRAYLKLGAIYPKTTAQVNSLLKHRTQESGVRLQEIFRDLENASHIDRAKKEFSLPKFEDDFQFEVGAEVVPSSDKIIRLLDYKHNVAYSPPISDEVNRKTEKVTRTTKGLQAEKQKTRPSKRYVNSWFSGHADQDAPLNFEQVYELGIQVSPKRITGSRTAGKPEFTEPASDLEGDLDIVVAIASDDFELLERPTKRMKLPKDLARSSDVVTFNVRPIKNEQEVYLTAFFFHKNHLFHEARISGYTRMVDVDDETDETAYAHTLNVFRGSTNREKCDLTIQIIKSEKNDSYRMALFYDFGGDQFDLLWCHLPINKDKIADLLKGVRRDILALVDPNNQDSFLLVFQQEGESVDKAKKEGRIPRLAIADDTTYQDALQRLAKAGRNLFVSLFDVSSEGTPEERERVRQMGRSLTALSAHNQLRVHILSEVFFMPWNLLYDGEYPSRLIDPQEFWGFKHVIEEMPYRIQEDMRDVAIDVEEKQFPIGLNINRLNISNDLSDPQLTSVHSWEPKVKAYVRFEEDQVRDALRGQNGPYLLEYFYCHAGTEIDAEQDIDRSFLGLTNATSGLTLRDIKLATFEKRFENRPLFILNACESGQIDGRFYDGFVPKFINMGACSVVGTDNIVPALFAAHFGIALVEAFLSGKPIGEALRNVRCEMLDTYRNPLGLIYRVFGNADVHLQKPIL